MGLSRAQPVTRGAIYLGPSGPPAALPPRRAKRQISKRDIHGLSTAKGCDTPSRDAWQHASQRSPRTNPRGASPSWTPGKAIGSRRVHPPQKSPLRLGSLRSGPQGSRRGPKTPALQVRSQGITKRASKGGGGGDTAGEIQAMIGPTSEKYAHMSNREVPKKGVVESRQGSDNTCFRHCFV
jgi:hypothetical protein